MFLFFAHIPFVVNHTIIATPPERLQHYSLSLHAAYKGLLNAIHMLMLLFSLESEC